MIDTMDTKENREGKKEPPENKDPSTGSKEKEIKEPSPEVILTRKEYEELTARLAELEGMKDRLLRSAADFENAKKRLTRERDDFVKFSQEGLLRDLLPVLDNLERALAHAGAPSADGGEKNNLPGILAGVRMVSKQLGEVLKNQGLKRLSVAGEIFNPNQHEAVGYVEEKGRDHEIVEEVEPGYLLHDRLLRAAKVRVRIGPSPEKSSDLKPEEEKQEEIT